MSYLLARTAHMSLGRSSALCKKNVGAIAAGLMPQQRFMSGKDVGDVIGIDLGTTNSCVAIMVSFIKSWGQIKMLFLVPHKMIRAFFYRKAAMLVLLKTVREHERLPVSWLLQTMDRVLWEWPPNARQ